MQENERDMSQGEKIAYLRKKNGMTQADLGVQLNVSYQAVSKWERDESYPDFDTISKIAKIFAVPIQYFEKGVGSEVLNESAPTRVESAPVAPVAPVEVVREPKLVGICRVCQKAVYEGDDVKTNKGLLCKACLKKLQKQAEEKKKEEELKKAAHAERVRWRRNAGLITGGCVAVFMAITGAFTQGFGIGLLTLLFVFTYTAQMFWEGAVKDCTFAGGHIIGSPGVIFTLDLDGLLFLVGVKLLFAVLRFLVWLFTVVVCALAAFFIAPFTFVPALLRVNQGDIEFYD